MSAREDAKRRAQASLASGDALSWFERLYADAQGNSLVVPWADLSPNPALVAWMRDAVVPEPAGGGPSRALVVGCGLGDDAEYLAACGLSVVAFDLSPSAIAWCKERHEGSTEQRVSYEVADLLDPPGRWYKTFDLVVEAYTVQSLPPGSAERARALSMLRTLVGRGGTLFIVARAADETPAVADGPPWPLVRQEIMEAGAGLSRTSYDDYVDEEGVRRFRASFQRMT